MSFSHGRNSGGRSWRAATICARFMSPSRPMITRAEAVFRYTRVRVLQDRALDGRVAAFQETIGDRLAELRAGRDPCQDAVLDALPVCDLDKHFIRQRCRSLEHGSAKPPGRDD